LGGPMAVNHLRQGSPVYVPRSWHFYKSHNHLPLTNIEGSVTNES
jgi:hypothetical protein